ncbi:UDP-3-O-[3-hydroxymyristoyl] N-acetylglucosamine deacetylase [Marinobacter sediminum]|uniref:UDP-3-O-acyl-N-acetylglucosamine deacetylase n=1 Tax=Marinobacter sediminum TaxID=256323 RepID=UPI00202F4005|nr:UDP-3-O-acyl-N-acetylglucosamine deacetylase [Marinobacter sediminum]MCM0611436.1 UDP-3-O-[3-hydroxymyristoyl] N-acetylglucosamine deacetylase [Marinobacter sediminum]
MTNKQHAAGKSESLQCTIAKPVHFVGRGLHSGMPVSMTLRPATADTGYVFHRLDVAPPHNQVAARWLSVCDTRLSTTIGNSAGVTVKTIEHLIAALSACGIDNCRIDIDGPEVPIMDGSAKPFVDQILATGSRQLTKERMAIVITDPIWVSEGDGKAGFVPFPESWIDMTIDFKSSAIGRQRVVTPVTCSHFSEHISAARTFGFAQQIETLKTLGLAKGGSLRNAVLIDQDQVVNPEGLRFDNEFVRHKIVDVIGDLSLLGVKIVGCFVGQCSGHRLNNQLLRDLMLQQKHWVYTTLSNAIENWEQIRSGSGKNQFELARPEQFAN